MKPAGSFTNQGAVELLGDGPVDRQSLGLSYLVWTLPWPLKKLAALAVRPWSKMLSDQLSASSSAPTSDKLWELNQVK